MGTSHNRWYVEQLFVKRAKSCDEKSIIRFLLECKIDKDKVRLALRHLPRSINFDYSELPTQLSKGLLEL